MTHCPVAPAPPASPLLAGALAVLTLAGCCRGGSAPPRADPRGRARRGPGTLNETTGVELTLATGALPDGVSGIANADGTGTQAPAFEGTITVVFAARTSTCP